VATKGRPYGTIPRFELAGVEARIADRTIQLRPDAVSASAVAASAAYLREEVTPSGLSLDVDSPTAYDFVFLTTL